MSEAKLNFEIELPDSSVNVEEWRRAQSVPENELPQLSPEQKQVAHKLGITEEAYARSVKAGEFGHERMLARARRFGECMETVLRELDGGVVDGVKADPFRGQWLVRVKDSGLILSLPRELVDDLVDSGRDIYLHQIRRLTRDQLSVAGERPKG